MRSWFSKADIHPLYHMCMHATNSRTHTLMYLRKILNDAKWKCALKRTLLVPSVEIFPSQLIDQPFFSMHLACVVLYARLMFQLLRSNAPHTYTQYSSHSFVISFLSPPNNECGCEAFSHTCWFLFLAHVYQTLSCPRIHTSYTRNLHANTNKCLFCVSMYGFVCDTPHCVVRIFDRVHILYSFDEVTWFLVLPSMHNDVTWVEPERHCNIL